MDFLYIIGEPGVGKSTLVAAMTEGLPYDETDSPFPFRRYDCGVTELGKRREDFSGTDALALNVQPTVVAYLEAVQPKLVLAEGDRLANQKFFNALEKLGYTVHVTALVGPGVAAKRRLQRGSHQDNTWLRGRQTKVRRLIEEWGNDLLDATQTVPELLEQLDDPVSAALLSQRVAVVG